MCIVEQEQNKRLVIGNFRDIIVAIDGGNRSLLLHLLHLDASKEARKS